MKKLPKNQRHVRFCITMNPDILKQLDKVVAESEFATRSGLITKAIVELLKS